MNKEMHHLNLIEDTFEIVDQKARQTLENVAYSHNSIFRGKFLGTAVTSAQYEAIANGTFEDLYLGDYWTIDDINWRIWGFDWQYGRRTASGTTSDAYECTTHHVAILPDENLLKKSAGTKYMSDTDEFVGGFRDSKMATETIPSINTILRNIFGSDHLVPHVSRYASGVQDGKATGGRWIYVTGASIPTRISITGLDEHGTYQENSMQTWLPLGMICPYYMTSRRLSDGITESYWLRNIASNTEFFIYSGAGYAMPLNASSESCGVRPYFLLGTFEDASTESATTLSANMHNLSLLSASLPMANNAVADDDFGEEEGL